MANEFVPFGLAPGPGYIVNPATWAASTVRTTGYGPGLLLKQNLNTAMRQSSSVATMVANFIAAHQAGDVLDNGDLVTLLSQFETAIVAMAGNSITTVISGNNGQITLPGSLGIRIKWGYTPLYGLDSINVFTFPAIGATPGPFPNTCFGAVAAAATQNGVGAVNYTFGVNTFTPNGFTLSNDSSASIFFYVAIGR